MSIHHNLLISSPVSGDFRSFHVLAVNDIASMKLL